MIGQQKWSWTISYTKIKGGRGGGKKWSAKYRILHILYDKISKENDSKVNSLFIFKFVGLSSSSNW